MQTAGVFDPVPITLLDIDVPAGATVRSSVYHNGPGSNSASIELRVTLLGATPVNLALIVLGEDTQPATDTTRLLPIDVAVPNLSALSADYAGMFQIRAFSEYAQIEVQNISGGPVHVKATVSGSEAPFGGGAPAVAAGAATSVQLVAGSADAGTVHLATGSAVALLAGAAVIGHVINDASSAVIGHVIVDASSAVIGHVIVDTLPALPAGTNSIGAVTVALPTVPYHGSVTVAAAGTRAQLATTQALKEGVDIEAHPGNIGLIYVGGVTVTAANGRRLSAGQSVFVRIADLATMYLDASVSGEGASYLGV